MKKLLAIFLTLLMAVSLFTITAYAAEEETPAYVAKIGDAQYTSLREAVTAAAGSEGPVTITLLASVQGSKITIPEGANIVLELNGQTITTGSRTITNNGTLTIQDTVGGGGVTSKTNVPIVCGSNSTTTIQSGSFTGREGAVITDTSTGATIEITGGTFTASDNAVIAGNGTAREGEGNTITITGGEFNGAIKTDGYIACGIYAPWNDTITVEGGTFNITGGAGIVARAGTVSVTGGTFNVTGTDTGWVGDNKNVLPSAAVVFDSNANYPGMTEESAVSITGGTFNSDDQTVAVVQSEEETTARVTVSGGTYSGDVSDYLAEDVQNVEYNTVIKAADCTNSGVGKLVKVVGGKETVSYYTIPAAHTYAVTATTPATCGEEGSVTYTCSVCNEGDEGHTKTEVIPATGKHTLGEADVTIDATCTEGAKIVKECEDCDYVEFVAWVDGSKALGHNLELDTSNGKYVAAKCEEGGLDTFKCSRCDYTEEKATEALGHDWDDGKHQEATCTTASGVLYTCKRKCGATKVDAYPAGIGEPALGHKEVASKDNKPATCNATGLTGKTVCEVCKITLKEGTVLPKDENAHQLDEENVEILKAKTCTTTGIGKYKCALCGEDLGYKSIPASHEYAEQVITPAKCFKEGESKFTCSACTADTEGHEITKVTPATGEHTTAETLIPATCTKPAMVGMKCTTEGCPYVENAQVVDGSEPLGHKWTENEDAEGYVKADCTKAGHLIYKCENGCGETKTEDVKALGHKWVETDEVVPASCEYGAGVVCTCENGCGETMVMEFEGELASPALGHKEVASKDNKPATCAETGLTGKTVCEECEKVIKEGTVLPIDKNAHVEMLARPALKEATCTTTGIGKYVCANCDTVLGYKSIPMTAHQVRSGTVETTKAATCTEDGEMTYTCSECEETITETLKARGHSFDEDVMIDATCTEPAKVGQKCSVCGAVGDAVVVEGSEPLDHKWVIDESAKDNKVATCTEAGHLTYKCENGCGETKTEDIEALGHDWVATGEYIEATCEYGAGEKYTCKNGCEEIMVKEFEDEELASPALGHKEVAAEDNKPATCKEAGLTGHTVCSVCKKTIKEGTELPIDENAHVEKLAEPVLKEATCTTTGIGKYVCAECDTVLGYKSIPMKAHTPVEKSIDITKESTCTEDGEMTFTCLVCNGEFTEVIKSEGHNFEENQPIDATCTEPAKVGRKCSVCGAVGDAVDVEDSEPLGHALVLDTENEAYVAATCDKGGLDTFKCSRCDYTEEKATDALGHDWDEGVASAEADCENAAGVKYTCKRKGCGATKVEEFEGELAQPATGHDYSIVVVTAPTCKNGGYTTHTCSKCGKSYTDSETEAVADAHVFELTTEMKPATCSATGIGKYTCSEGCGTTKYATIAMKEHTLNQLTAKTTIEATCTEPGEMTMTCDVCKAEVAMPIEALGHDLGDVKASEDGNYVYKACSRCDYIEIVECLVHTPAEAVRENEVDATCETAGSYEEVVYCTVCGEEISREPKTIEKLAHTPGEAVRENEVDATCETAGSYDEVVYCTECKTEISRETKTIEKTAHTPAEAIRENEEAATCTKEGSYDEVVKCSVCGVELSRTPKTIEKLEHTAGEAVRENEEAATCTEVGSYDEVVKCSVCGVELSRTPKTVEKTAHTPAEAIRENEEAATCTKEGSYDEVVKCSVCGVEMSRTPKTIEKVAHTPGTAVREEEVAATCKAEGSYDEVVYCTVCEAEISREAKVIDKLEHTWDEGKVTKEATCTEVGVKTYTCKVEGCGETKTEEIPVIEHAWDAGKVTTEPTCDEAGVKTYTCSACGATKTETVAAAGHSWGEAVVTKAATCTEAGEKTSTCSVCGATKTERINPTGHPYDATVNGDGTVTYTCPVCGDSFTE